MNMFSNSQVDASNVPISKQRRRSFVKSNTQACDQYQFKIFEDEKKQEKDNKTSF